MEKDVEINNDGIQYAKQMKKESVKELLLWIIGTIILCTIIIIIAFYTKTSFTKAIAFGVSLQSFFCILVIIIGTHDQYHEIDNRILIKEMIDAGSNYDMEIIDTGIVKIEWTYKNKYRSVLIHNYNDLPIIFNTSDGERIYGVQINDDLSAVITK